MFWFFILFFPVTADRIRLDPTNICEIKYNIEALNTTVNKLLVTAGLWQNYQGLQLQKQIALYKDRPVFKATGTSLQAQLRTCAALQATFIEFENVIDQTAVATIMKANSIDTILLYLEINNNIIFWPTSGKSFQYQIFDQETTLTWKGMASYQCYNGTHDVNTIAKLTTIGDAKALCHATRNNFFESVTTFKTNVQLQIETLEDMTPPILKLLEEAIDLMQSPDLPTENDTKTKKNAKESKNTNPERQKTTTTISPLDTLTLPEPDISLECWPALIQPFPPMEQYSVTNVRTQEQLLATKLKFKHFKNSYLMVRSSLIDVISTLKSSTLITPDIIPAGFANTITHFDLKNDAYLSLLILFLGLLSFIGLSPFILYCCFHYRKNSIYYHGMYTTESDKPRLTDQEVEDLPLSLRRN